MNLILSDSFEQTRFWARERGFARNECRHVRSVQDTRGYRGDDVALYVVGTQRRLDIGDIVLSCRARGIKVIWQ